ncbi:MAG: hypothetical protein ISF22_02140 [Methanomassiliicoccus sp.]|nr:hypothetical protein [Methanomassiliicoccus sp.]
MSMRLEELVRRLGSRYDVERWWPAESPWEIMVGAILVQRTAWENATMVLDDLRARGLLEVDAIDDLPLERLERLVRPAGFYRQKARSIKAMAAHLRGAHRSDPLGLLSKHPGSARKELLSLPGVGKETADAILLFAGRRPRFIAAAYVSRVLSRTGLFASQDYDEVQRYMEARLEPDPSTYARCYALMVQHARSTCRTRPLCDNCVLMDACAFTGRTGREGCLR